MQPFLLELSGKLTGSCGNTIDVHCRLEVPPTFGIPLKIDLGVPSTPYQSCGLQNPCSFQGSRGSLHIKLDEVWYRRISAPSPKPPPFQLYPIELSHVGRLMQEQETTREWENPDRANITELIAYLSPTRQIQAVRGWGYPDRESHSVQLFAVRVPGLGEIGFYKEWVRGYSNSMSTLTGLANFYARIEIPDFQLANLDTYIDLLKGYLRVLSMFGRQQMQLWALSINQSTSQTSIWIDPLDPYKPPNIHSERSNFLIWPEQLSQMGTAALAAYSQLSSPMKAGIDQLLVSITPFLDIRHSQRFVNIMHALDAHELWPAPTSHTLTDSDTMLLDKFAAMLRDLEGGATTVALTQTIDRVKGYVEQIRNPTMKLATKMRAFEKSHPQLVNDLWPLFGKSKLPGLVKLRDRLSHKGALGVEHQAMAVATSHLAVLAERIVLQVLGLDIEQTQVSARNAGRDEWHAKDYWSALQRTALV